MRTNAKPVRIEPAFDDREQIRDMFERYAPYRALAAYAPWGVEDATKEEAKWPVLPWFRGDWALAGQPLASIPTEPDPPNKSACIRAGNPLEFSRFLDRPR